MIDAKEMEGIIVHEYYLGLTVSSETRHEWCARAAAEIVRRQKELVVYEGTTRVQDTHSGVLYVEAAFGRDKGVEAGERVKMMVSKEG